VSHSPACPSCRAPMEVHRFDGHSGVPLELDLCFSCQGLWFDRHENLRLTPGAVVSLFKLLHERQAEQHHPVAQNLACPRCAKGLEKGFDVVRTGRYVTYRCGAQHGRFSAFSSFMVEKGFVRHLTEPEIEELAKQVDSINCTSCGAPVDIRKDHACPYCRSAFSLLDPNAVVRAMEGYARAAHSRPTGAAVASGLGDALVALERDRLQAGRERASEWRGMAHRTVDSVTTVDLLAAGLALVWGVMKD
jgi:Zn-finger nucleic acid-binding protein